MIRALLVTFLIFALPSCETSEPAPEVQKPAPPGTRIRITGGIACAIDGTGTLWCWGDDYFDVPRPWWSEGEWTSLSLAETHTCLGDATHVECWGDPSALTTPPPDVPVGRLEAGIYADVGFDGLGRVYSWGKSEKLTPPDRPWSMIAIDDYWACGVDGAGNDDDGESGPLSCWGFGGWTDVAPPEGAFQSVDLSQFEGCALDVAGRAACWRVDGWINGKVEAVPPDDVFVRVAAGNSLACGVRADGSLRCWNSLTGADLPVPALPPVIDLDLSGYVCALVEGGKVACFDPLDQPTFEPPEPPDFLRYEPE